MRESAPKAGKITAILIAVIFYETQRGCAPPLVQLVPPSVDNYVSEDHPSRVLDGFVDSLDLVTLKQLLNKGRFTYWVLASAVSEY